MSLYESPLSLRLDRRYQKEIRYIEGYALNNSIYAYPSSDDPYEWRGYLYGPPNSLYAGGEYEFRVYLSPEYPFKKPIIRFYDSRMYHPNVDDMGNIHTLLLKDGEWNPNIYLYKIFEHLYELLIDPGKDLDSVKETRFTTALREYRSNPDRFNRRTSV